jgi:hypothetical protein
MSLPSHATIRRTTDPIASQNYGMNNPSAGIFKQSSGGLVPSRNRVIEPARQQHRLADLIPWKRVLG